MLAYNKFGNPAPAIRCCDGHGGPERVVENLEDVPNFWLVFDGKLWREKLPARPAGFDAIMYDEMVFNARRGRRGVRWAGD